MAVKSYMQLYTCQAKNDLTFLIDFFIYLISKPKYS